MARLVRDHSAGAYAVRVACLHCGAMLQLSDAVIDRDGPSFRAYYHDACYPTTQDLRVDSCNRDGCTRCKPGQRLDRPAAP